MGDDMSARLMKLRMDMLRNQMSNGESSRTPAYHSQMYSGNSSMPPLQQNPSFGAGIQSMGVAGAGGNTGSMYSLPAVGRQGYASAQPYSMGMEANRMGGFGAMNGMANMGGMGSMSGMHGMGMGGVGGMGGMGGMGMGFVQQPPLTSFMATSGGRSYRVRQQRRLRQQKQREARRAQEEMLQMMQALQTTANNQKAKKAEDYQMEHLKAQDEHMKMLVKLMAAGSFAGGGPVPGVDAYFNEPARGKSSGPTHVDGIPVAHAEHKTIHPARGNREGNQNAHSLHRRASAHRLFPHPHLVGHPGTAAAAAAVAATEAVKQHFGKGNDMSTEQKEVVKQIDLDHGTGKKSKHVLDEEDKSQSKKYIPEDDSMLEKLSLEELVAMEDKEIDVAKTMNFDYAKKSTEEEIEREKKKMRLKAQLQNQKGRSSAVPMWRHKARDPNANPEPLLVLRGAPLFKAFIHFLIAAFHLRKLRDVRDEKNRLTEEPNTSKVLLGLNDSATAFIARAIRVPIQSILRDEKLTMDVEKHVFHYGPLGILTKSEKTSLDSRMLKLRVRAEGIIDRICSQDSVENGLSIGVLTYLTTLMDEKVWWPAHFLFHSECDELLISPPCTVALPQRLLKAGGDDERKFRKMAARLVHGLLLHRCLIHALVKPESLGLGKPRNVLVRKNICLVASLIYEILRRSNEGEFPKASLKNMRELEDLRNPLVQFKAQFMRLPHMHVPHIHDAHTKWKKDHHEKSEKKRKKKVKQQRKSDKKKAGGGSDSDTDSDTDSDSDKSDKASKDGKKNKKGKDAPKKSKSKKKDGSKSKDKNTKKGTKGKTGSNDSDADSNNEDDKEEADESKTSRSKPKKVNTMKASSEKTPEVLRGAFKIRKTKAIDTAGNVKWSKEQLRKKYIQLTHDCIYQYADKELTILEGEYFLRNVIDLREKATPGSKFNYAFIHQTTDHKNPENLDGKENIIDNTVELNFESRYQKDVWISRIKMWKRREHPVYHQQHATMSDTDLADHLFPFRRFKKGRKQLDDHWLEEQADKLNEWVKNVVEAVIMRMSPEGAAKQDEVADMNKSMDTPRA